MNQLSRIAAGHAPSRPVRSGALTDFVDARARLRAARAGAPVCRWRRDPVTDVLHCVWTARGAAHEPASPVPLCLAS